MPLLWLGLAFLAGILAGAVAGQPVITWGAATLIAVSFILIELRWLTYKAVWQNIKRWLPLPVGVLLVGFFLGGLRWQMSVPNWGPDDLAFYHGTAKAELTGWISDYPDRREGAVLLRVRVESIQSQNGAAIPVTGDALLRLPPGRDWHYGDRVLIWGIPAEPPDEADFSYKGYLARRGIHTYMAYPGVSLMGSGAGNSWMARIFQLREFAYNTINRIFPQPEAALLAGVLLGLDHDLPESIEKAFQDTGTAHIVAISGFNMSVLAALLISLFGRFLPRGWTALTAAVTITFYTLLVGANPAVVRAAIMSSLALFGRLIGRGSSGVTPLTLSAAVMCAFNPLLPWDAGFQLSFTATLGLILYGEPMQKTFETWVTNRWGDVLAKRLAGPVGEYFLFTLAAQITTLPVVLYHFNRLSISAVLANPLILPAQPGVMILGGIALIAGMLSPALGQILAWLAWPLAAFTLQVVELLARIPSGAISVGEFRPWMLAGSYALLFGLTFGWRKLTTLQEKIKPGLVFASLGLVTLVAWSAVLRRPDGRLHITMLDQPEGQAVVLTMPGGQRVLVGGTAGANQLGSDLGRLTGPFDRKLDALILPSASANRLEGLPLLIERFPVEQAFWAVAPPDKRVAENINQALSNRGTPVTLLESGSRLQLDENVILQVLAVDEDDAALQLEYGNLCLVWPGGIAPDEMKQSGARINGCLLLADETAALDAWAKQRPVQFIFFGAAPAALPGALSTQSHGQIEIISDGTGLWVEVEREPKKE